MDYLISVKRPVSVTVFARETSLRHDVIARSFSDEAIPCKEFYSWDCFVAKAPRNDDI
ncbi:MAG: hypothetical protein FWC80_02375 [Firmicutes bacterium]|nr:hypothetical protein [Bacillota bacterium]